MPPAAAPPPAGPARQAVREAAGRARDTGAGNSDPIQWYIARRYRSSGSIISQEL